MEQKVFHFTEAEPLLAFIAKHRSKIIGHTLKACYINDCMYTSGDSSGSVFFVLDDICFGVEYLLPSDITIFPVDENDFEITGEINEEPEYKLLYYHSHIPNRRDEGVTWCTEMPAMGQKIIDLEVDRFSDAFQSDINDYRPNGGDYFSCITFTLEDGSLLYINAQSAEMDGYVDLWLTNLPVIKTIQRVLDNDPERLHFMIRHELDQVVNACKESPDDMAKVTMYYLRKCLNEDQSTEEKGYGRNYSDLICDVLRALKNKEINLQYKDSTGLSVMDLALKASEKINSRVLPALLTDSGLDFQFNRMKANLSCEYNLLQDYKQEMRKLYDSLPDRVRYTEFGEKLVAFINNDYHQLFEQMQVLFKDFEELK